MVVVAWSNLVSAQGPLVLVLGLKGFGLRVWGQGLTISHLVAAVNVECLGVVVIYIVRAVVHFTTGEVPRYYAVFAHIELGFSLEMTNKMSLQK